MVSVHSIVCAFTFIINTFLLNKIKRDLKCLVDSAHFAAGQGVNIPFKAAFVNGADLFAEYRATAAIAAYKRSVGR